MSKAYTLITGASSGMGALCAKQFSATQNLILASENLEQLEQVRSECQNPENILLWHCNFGTEREHIVDSLTNLLKSNDAVIDKYLHFAGINKLAPLKSASIQMIDLTFNVNFFSIIATIPYKMKDIINKMNIPLITRFKLNIWVP